MKPRTKAGRELVAFAASITNFLEPYPVLSEASIERLTEKVLAIEDEAGPPETVAEIERLEEALRICEEGHHA